LPQTGSFTVRVFTSQAQIPISNATVTVSRRAARGKHKLLAVRVTNENGEILPISVSTPAASESESPGTPLPFASLDIRVEHPDYQMEVVEDVQIFPGVVSILPVALFPLPERVNPHENGQTVLIPPQTL